VADLRLATRLIGQPDEESLEVAQGRVDDACRERTTARLALGGFQMALEGPGLLGVERGEIGAGGEPLEAGDRRGGPVDRSLGKTPSLLQPDKVAAKNSGVAVGASVHGVQAPFRR
jgi:hypothetical protein